MDPQIASDIALCKNLYNPHLLNLLAALSKQGLGYL